MTDTGQWHNLEYRLQIWEMKNLKVEIQEWLTTTPNGLRAEEVYKIHLLLFGNQHCKNKNPEQIASGL